MNNTLCSEIQSSISASVQSYTRSYLFLFKLIVFVLIIKLRWVRIRIRYSGEKLAVINALGRVFMPPMDSPWQVVVEEIKKLQTGGVQHIFVDFHAEATAEKIAMGYYLDGKVH